MSKLFLLDAMALIYRAYFALNKNPRINSKGLNTSAVLGFANTLYDLLKNAQPTHLGVAFDTMAPTARHLEFTGYKATREAMPEDLATAIPYIKRLVEAFNIPLLFVDGYEADDVIGTLAKKASEAGFITYMVTPDKDFSQLVSDQVLIYKPGKMGEKPEIIGPEDVCQKYGLKRPEQMIDLLGLWGDASDNIPGIPGIGQVYARKLLETFDNVENLIANAARIENPGQREKVITYADQALMSKMLATIITDVPIAFDEDKLKIRQPDRQALRELLDELEFRTFAKRVFTDLSLQEGAAQTPPADLFSGLPVENQTTGLKTIHESEVRYHLVQTAEEIQNLIKKLSGINGFCFDTETTGLDPNHCELVGISFCIEAGEAWFLLLPPVYEEASEILRQFKPLFTNPGIRKTGQNLKFDISVLHWYDIEVRGPLFDTMLAHYLLQPDMRHNMDLLAETYLAYRTIPIESLIGKKGKDQGNMRQVDPVLLKDYACEDADITLQLAHIFEPELEKTGTNMVLREIEAPLVPVLASMEAEGIRIDRKTLDEYAIQLAHEIENLETEIMSLAGVSFNIASPKQLGEVLFDHLQIAEKPKQTSKTKQYSTGEEILLKLVNKHPIIPKILDYRSLTKLKSTYVDTLPQMINTRTGRVHTSFNQAVAATGRLSSNNPNLQNIPIRTERGREIRKAFVPRNRDYVLLSADYSQIELRLMAELSGDKAMTEAFLRGEDIHLATAAKVYRVAADQVNREMRRNAKTVNFGIIYGISAFGLSERLNIPRKEAAALIEAYFLQYPGIKNYMEETIRMAREQEYVETIMKRRRYIRDINSGNAAVRGFAERNAINAPIQGSAADMIKIAMINIFRALEDQGLKSKMILQVHDELVFDAFREELPVLLPLVTGLMKTAIPLKVPVEVEVNTGENWLEAH
ncbi:MAG TPA: DNA polymerase I [Bacteroidales bacterium]|nr:DNA polymerase I [Bacteroidales bacterium]HSA42220.1 DNA polymerase I [Bacteroidales bacterium]